MTEEQLISQIKEHEKAGDLYLYEVQSYKKGPFMTIDFPSETRSLRNVFGIQMNAKYNSIIATNSRGEINIPEPENRKYILGLFYKSIHATEPRYTVVEARVDEFGLGVV